MNLISIFVLLFVLIIVSIAGFIFCTRQGKNFMISTFKKNKYVVCHLRRTSSDFEEIYLVVPTADFFTVVGKYTYNLNPAYAMMRWKGRLHFVLNENDAIPKYLSRFDTKEEILMQVAELKTALHNRAYDFLYVKNKNMALILAAIGLGISIFIALYAVYEIQKIEPIISYIASHPAQQSSSIIVGQ